MRSARKCRAALRETLTQEREKAQAVEERRLKDLETRVENEARARGAQFTGRLLTRLACAEVEARIANMVLEDLPLLPAEQVQAIVTGAATGTQAGGRSVKVTSAFPLSAAQRTAITQKLRSVAGDQIAIEFKEDSSLLAGLRIAAGPWVLGANLGDELQFFTSALRDDSQNH